MNNLIPNKLMMKPRIPVIALLGLLAILPFTTQNVSAAKAIATTFFGNKAIGGYDTVAYHTTKKAVAGNKRFSTQWNGATWLFSSSKNLQLFKAEPKKYAPQYGGYCSWAAAANKLVKADPKIFDVYNNKLYLNYDKKTKREWNADRVGMVQRGDRNFPKLIAN